MIIREEAASDIEQITAITAAAFAPKPYSNGSEPAVIAAVRASGDLTLSLVAEEDGVILGQITFTPVAVRPDRQSEGIGAALIKDGLARLKQLDAAGCVLVGNPDYYGRFGFQNHCGLSYSGLDARIVQKRVLAGPDKTGKLTYCDSFEAAARGV